MKPSETQNPKHISVASGITVPLPSAPAQDALKKAILIEVFPLSESQGRFGAPPQPSIRELRGRENSSCEKSGSMRKPESQA